MGLRTVILIALCISCVPASKHERQKWKEAKFEEDCEKPVKGFFDLPSKDSKHFSGKIGSIPGKPGVDYPNLTEIPYTKFSCYDQDYIPGFYADLETNCQVFHVCYENRRESFLCPVGTIFNQPIAACDYWYSANCSLSADYPQEEVSALKSDLVLDPIIEETISFMFEKISEQQPKEPDETIFKPDKKPVKPTTPESTSTIKTAEPDMKAHKLKPYSFLKSGRDLDEKIHGIRKPEKELVAESLALTKDKGKKATSEVSSEPDLKSKQKGREAVKGDAEAAVGLIIKSLLPIKAKVIDLIAEQIRKPKSTDKAAKLDSKKQVKVESAAEPKTVSVKTVATEEAQKPPVQHVPLKLSYPKVFTAPAVKPVPKPAARSVLQQRPVAIQTKPPQKQVFYQPEKIFPGRSSLPVSLLTQKQLALNYAKLLKLKKLKILKSPLLGLKGFL